MSIARLARLSLSDALLTSTTRRPNMNSDGTVVGAMPPPPGVIANFDSPESIAHRVIIIAVLGAVIAIPVCLVRLYTKRAILRTFGWDDCERPQERW